MFISFELRQGKPNRDLTRTIRVYVSHNGKAYYSTKYSIKEGDWDGRRSRVRDSNMNHMLWNFELTRLRNDIEGLCLKHPNTSARDIVNLIGKKSIENFVSFFEKYIADCENGTHKRAINSVKKYRQALATIKSFVRRTDFDTINEDWYNAYVVHLRTKEDPMNDNTIGNTIKNVKAVMRRAFDAGISTNVEYLKKYFKSPSKPTDSIYLTEDDMLKWTNCDLSSFPHLQAERDRFLIAYYFLLRFGDSLRFNASNIFKEGERHFLRLTAEKTIRTNDATVVPVKPAIYELLKKYDFKMPHTSNAEANWKLKEIGREADIDQLVTCNGHMKRKYHFITTHTARRSGATNLYLQGASPKDLMSLGGWRSHDQMMDYLKLSKLDSATKAAEMPFYK